MAYQYKLQVPISRELNKKLKAKVAKTGLSSVNDIVRMFLVNYVNGTINLTFVTDEEDDRVMLAEGEELEKLIEAAHKDHKQGKTKTLDFSKNIHEQLMSD